MKEQISNIQAVILAGGKGQRMGELIQDRQKCMLEVAGTPILQHIFNELKDGFGENIDVILATGYRGNDIRDYFGDDYEGINITYAHDPKPLETRKRLMLAKDLIVKPFLLLAGDVLTPGSLIRSVSQRFEREKMQKTHHIMGVISGAVDHSPAPSHAILSVNNGYLEEVIYPPHTNIKTDLREIPRAIYSLDFLEAAQKSTETFLSNVIKEVVRSQSSKIGVEKYEDQWGHFAQPEDLQKYNSLPFLR